jgi:hypothetical protein
MTPYTPSRHKSHNVLRFVPVLQRVADNPEPVTIMFDPTALGLSQETAIARLRDAKTAFTSGKVFHPGLDADRLRAMWPKYRVSTNETHVILVPAEMVQAQPQVGSITALATVKADDVELLTAFATVFARRAIIGSVKISGVLDPELEQQIRDKFDIEFIHESPIITIMI